MKGGDFESGISVTRLLFGVIGAADGGGIVARDLIEKGTIGDEHSGGGDDSGDEYSSPALAKGLQPTGSGDWVF